MIAAIFILIASAHLTFGMSDLEFQARASALQKKQTETDTLMNKLGAGSDFRKMSFAQSKDEPKDELPLFQVHADLSNVRVPTGKFLYAKTLNRLVVGGDSAPVLLVLDSDQGVLSQIRIMGVAHQSGTHGRLTFELTKLLLRSGRAISIQGTGLDSDGANGVAAQVFSGKALAIAGAVASSFVSGLAASQQTQNINAFGFVTQQPSGRNGILQGVAQTAADQSKRLIDEATTEKPLLILESQTPVVVLIQEEVRW